MNNIANFEQFNESVLGSLFLGFVTAYLIYKFLKGLERDLMRRKEDKKVITTFLDMINMKEIVAISEFNDRYFIRLSRPDNKEATIDLRVYKETKELVIGIPSELSRKFTLSNEQYSRFLSIVKQAN